MALESDEAWRNVRDTVRYRFLRDVIHRCSRSGTKDGDVEVPYDRENPNPSKYLVLVLDHRATRILNSVLRMYDITAEGCSVAEPLEKNRRPFPDLEAIYIIDPTLDSINRICNDFASRSKALYSAVHLFFISKAGKEIVDTIKRCKVLVQRIKTLVEINLDFLAVETNTFHLDMPDALVRLYGDTGAPGAGIKREQCKSDIVKRLVTLCATLNEYPYIRFRSENELCSQLAKDFHHKLNEFLNENSDFWWKGDGIGNHGDDSQRGTLLLLDRREDPSMPLLHSFTYQAMINDLLDIQDDVLRFINDSGANQRVLLSESDNFWVELRHRHMANVLKSLKNYTDEFQEIDPRAGLKDDKGEVSVEGLINAVHALPEYGELKEKHLNHLNISAQCMFKLESLSLLKCVNVEQTMVTGGVNSDGKELSSSALTLELMNLVKDPTVGVEETTRLLGLYVITQRGIQESDRRRIMAAANPPLPLDAQNAIINLSYLGVPINTVLKKKAKTAEEKQSIAEAKRIARSCEFSYSRYQPILPQLLQDMLSNRLPPESFRYVIEPPPSARSFGNYSDSSSLRRDTGSTTPLSVRSHGMSGTSSTARGLNGKLSRFGTNNESLNHKNRKKTGARVIIFIIGGVTHSELQAMYEIMQNSDREIVIGSTHLLRPNQYIFDLKHLDREGYAKYDKDTAELQSKVSKNHAKIDATISGIEYIEKDSDKPVDFVDINLDLDENTEKENAGKNKKSIFGCGCVP